MSISTTRAKRVASSTPSRPSEALPASLRATARLQELRQRRGEGIVHPQPEAPGKAARWRAVVSSRAAS